MEEIDHTTAEVLTGLQLPFHTHCDYFLDDEHTISLHLELPTQEEVIPETTKTILKNGETKDMRRTESERAMDYTRLAMGVVVFMAAELASYLPTVLAQHGRHQRVVRIPARRPENRLGKNPPKLDQEPAQRPRRSGHSGKFRAA